MRVTPTSLPEVLIVEPRLFRDDRGFFLEQFNESRWKEAGLNLRFSQDNRSRSRKGVLRGLHFQVRRPQGKLVTVAHGSVYDVAVDIRRGSPTFGQWCGVELHADEPRSLWIPPGFAHGFCVLSESAELLYKCTEVYSAVDDRGVLWSDPDIAIEWPVSEPLLSAKDEFLPLLRDVLNELSSYGS